MVYTTDLGPHGPRYVTRDQANQKINWSTPAPVNWLKEGEKARDDDAGKPPVVHIHEACDEAPTSPDILERLGNIEQAIAKLADMCGYNGGGEEYEGEEGRAPGDPEPMTNDQPSAPPSPSAINAANREAWGTKGHTLTGMSQSIPPSSNKAEGAEYQPNQAGSIDVPARLSRTDRTLNSGKTFGVTEDALRVGQMHARATALVNKQINSIQQKQNAFWKRG